MVHYFPNFPYLDQSCFAHAHSPEDDNLCIIKLKTNSGFLITESHNLCIIDVVRVPREAGSWRPLESLLSGCYCHSGPRAPSHQACLSEKASNGQLTNNSETEPVNLSSVTSISHIKLNSRKLCMHFRCSAYIVAQDVKHSISL